MKCKNCNTELLDNTSFCPYCGTKCVEKEVEVVENYEYKKEMNQEKDEEAPCWAKFAKVSSILGTISICIFWIPFLGLLATETGTAGIVFGALGKKTKKIYAKELANSGFTKSLVALILSIVSFIITYIFIVVFALASME